MKKSRLFTTRTISTRSHARKSSRCSTNIWPTRLTSTARPNRLIGTSKALISSRCTSCSISSPHNWRTTLIPSPSGRPPWAAQRRGTARQSAAASSLPEYPPEATTGTQLVEALAVRSTPHLPQRAGRRSRRRPASKVSSARHARSDAAVEKASPGSLRLTPLALALVMVETTDLIFAVDSIPAIFAITADPFLVFTSNVFTMLGLRSLFFALAGELDSSAASRSRCDGVLVVGLKMFLAETLKSRARPTL